MGSCDVPSPVPDVRMCYLAAVATTMVGGTSRKGLCTTQAFPARIDFKC